MSLFDEHLDNVLNYWPEVIDVEAIPLAEGDYDLTLRHSMALSNYYDDNIGVKTQNLQSAIEVQLCWLVYCQFAKLAKQFLSKVRVREIRRSVIKDALHTRMIDYVLPQIRGEADYNRTYDLDEAKTYMLAEGLAQESDFIK